jgi:hypothetical protein
LQNEELYNVHSQLKSIWVMKLRRTRCIRFVARTREMISASGILVGKLEQEPG